MGKGFAAVLLLIFIALSQLMGSSTAQASSLNLMRRWVVFPFESDLTQKAAAERAWWKSRELLTEKKKFLVASRQFLNDKDVMQPRKTLRPEDVKLLGNLLDADVLVTGFSEKRQFTLNVYLVQNGALFWSKHLNFHPSLKADDQLELTSESLTKELISVIPYQAFTVVDPLINQPVFDEAGKSYAVVDTGTTDEMTVGTEIQWVDIDLPDGDETRPLIGESKETVIGEGRVTKVKRGVVVAEILREKDKDAIKEKTLVRIPKEAEKLAKSFNQNNPYSEKLAPELLPDSIAPIAIESKAGHRAPLIFGTIISFLGIIAIAL